MGKKIFIVSSSPRKDGNSDILAEQFARGATQAGHSVKKVNIREMNLQFCLGCFACLQREGCVQRDDMNGLYAAVQSSDVLVFATPVYYYAVSGQLKTFLDRLNPLYPRENNFKEVYLLATSAEGEESAMDGSVKDVQGWIDCFDGVTLKGVLRGIGVNDKGDVLSTDFPAKAYEMGKNV